MSDADTIRQWWRTSIIDMEPGRIAFRGHAVEDLIGNVSFPQMIWLMTRGGLPSASFSMCSRTTGSTGVCLSRCRKERPSGSLASPLELSVVARLSQVDAAPCAPRGMRRAAESMAQQREDELRPTQRCSRRRSAGVQQVV